MLADELRRRRHGKGGAGRRSWHVDETYLRVRGRWCSPYRASDRKGDLVDTMLSEHRDMAAAKAFFRSAKSVTGMTPDRVTTDGHRPYPRAIRSTLGRGVQHRTSRFKNNSLEQDYRGIKGRIRCMRGFDVCAASGLSRRPRGSAEATMSYATISVPAPVTASTFPPAADVSSTSVARPRHSPFCKPRRPDWRTMRAPCPPWRERLQNPPACRWTLGSRRRSGLRGLRGSGLCRQGHYHPPPRPVLQSQRTGPCWRSRQPWCHSPKAAATNC